MWEKTEKFSSSQPKQANPKGTASPRGGVGGSSMKTMISKRNEGAIMRPPGFNRPLFILPIRSSRLFVTKMLGGTAN